MRKRHLACLPLLACAALARCADDRPTVDVQVQGLSGDIRALSVELIPADRSTSPWPARTLTGRLDRFRVRLPADTGGDVTLRIGGLGADLCELAWADARVHAARDASVALKLRRHDEGEQGCRLDLQKVGGGAGEVEDAQNGFRCKAGQDACSAVFPRGTRLVLVARRSFDSSYFAGWSGACSGTGACELTIASGSSAVQAGFVPLSVCQEGWCWESPRPLGNALNAVWVGAPAQAWAAGGAGTLLRWNGTFWGVVQSGMAATLWGLWGSGPDDVWAVGEGGTLLHWDGKGLGRVDSGVTTALRAVWGRTSRDVWAAGDAGTILHWDGTGWSPQPSGTRAHLRALAGSGSPGEVWAAGQGGAMLRWDSAAWSSVPSGTASDLRALWTSPSGEAVAAGAGGTVLRWDGAAWKAGPGPAADLLSVWGSGPADLWAAGDPGPLWHFDGSAWLRRSIDAPRRVRALGGSGPADLWAVGAGASILHWNGAFLTDLAPGPRDHFLAIWRDNRRGTSARAIDDHGNIMVRQGTSWSQAGIYAGLPIHAVDLTSDADWAVGDGGIIYTDAASVNWLALASGTRRNLYGVWANTDDDIWVVGDAGTILHGQARVFTASGAGVTERALHGVTGFSADDVWTVGEGGTILHYDGTGWSQVASGTAAGLRGIWGHGARDFWVVGDAGTLLHYQGTSFARIASGTSANLRNANGPAPEDVWIVGEAGTLLHYLNGAVSPVHTGTANALNAINGDPFGNVWIAGDDGAILHYLYQP